MNIKYTLALVFTATCSISQAALVAHGVGAAGGALSLDSPVDYSSLTGISASSDGVSFTYDITITAALVRTTEATHLGNGENGAFESFIDAHPFSVSISINPASISGGTVTFDGFTGFTAAAASGGDGFAIDGTEYRVVGGDVTIANNGYHALSSNLDPGATGGTFAATALATTNNGVILSGLSWEFTTAVPEPSSAALLGLGGLALILRRRK